MKKMMKKLIAMAAALVMIVTLLPAMGVNAEAERQGSITIHKTTQDATKPLAGAGFTIYQMVQFGWGGNGEWVVFSTSNGASATVGMSIDKIDMTQFDTELAKSESITTPFRNEQQTGANGETVFDKLPMGIYLVKETKVPDATDEYTYAESEPFYVSIPMTETITDEDGKITSQEVIYDVTATPKNAETGGGKVIEETTGDQTNDVSETDAGIGDPVNYKISVIAPANGTKFSVQDTINGLNYNQDSIDIRALGVNSGSNNYTTLTRGTDYTVNFSDSDSTVEGNDCRQMTITFSESFRDNKAYFGKTVEIRYSALVASDALVGVGNDNTAQVDYGNGYTPIYGDPDVYLYGVTLTKKAADTDAVMPGVVFELYEEDGSTPITDPIYGAVADDENQGKFVTDGDGKINIKNLVDGTYVLKEVKTANDYTLLANPITITIDTDAEGYSVANPKVTVSGAVDENTDLVKDENTHYYTFTVENQPGFSLPSTGGMGTYLFTIGGIVIMAGAAFALIAMKKRA